MLRGRQIHESEFEEESSVAKSETRKKMSSAFLNLLMMFVFVVYALIPFLIYFSPAMRSHAVFLNYVNLSKRKNLSLPEESGLNCTRHFYIDAGDSVKLGVWHIQPSTAMSRCQNGLIPAVEEFEDGRPVYLYLHGNGGTRAAGHRVALYKVLSEKINAHVIAFDYRGYGDSTNVSPSEFGLVEDTYHVYKWLLKRVKPSRIFIWGHSLGTGVGVSFLHRLTSCLPAALILEAPFTKITDAAKHHPLSIFYRHMPFFDELIAKHFEDEHTGFDSLGRIGQVKCPILILHAEDDGYVSFQQGKKLHEVALKERKSLQPHATQFVGFERKLDYGHKKIYKSPELPGIIIQFIKKTRPKIAVTHYILNDYLCSKYL